MKNYEQLSNQKPVRNVQAQSPMLWQIETKPRRPHESGITSLDGDATLKHANICEHCCTAAAYGIIIIVQYRTIHFVFFFSSLPVSIGVANFFGRVAFVGFLVCLVFLLLAALSYFAR